jgi:hypothetical protein
MSPPRKLSTEDTEMHISVSSVLFPWLNAVTVIVRICHNIIRNSLIEVRFPPAALVVSSELLIMIAYASDD